MRKFGLTRIAAAALITGAITACSPIVDKRGYVPNPEDLNEVEIGVDNKSSIRDRLGSPSSIGTFETDTWYYISSTTEQVAFYRPEVIDREIVAIYFDDQSYVREVAYYGLEDGQIVNYIDRETPTRGRELTFLEQLFGNFGRFARGGGAIPTDE